MPDLESAIQRSRWTTYPTRLLTSRTPFQRRLKLILLGCAAFLCVSYLYAGPSYAPRSAYVQDGAEWWDVRYWDVPFSPRRQRIQKTLERYRLAPDDPFPHQLPPGRSILPDIATTSLPPPKSRKAFPDELLHTLYPSAPPETVVAEHIVNPRTPVHEFIKNWTSPAWFRTEGTGKALPRVQAEFGKVSVSGKRRKVNAERAEAVKRAFVYAWQRYKDKAWGKSFPFRYP